MQGTPRSRDRRQHPRLEAIEPERQSNGPQQEHSGAEGDEIVTGEHCDRENTGCPDIVLHGGTQLTINETGATNNYTTGLLTLMAGTGFILPDFVFSLLLGVVIRNAATLTGLFRVSDATVDVVGNVALSLFLVMALMTMRLLDLVNLAGPLFVILALQTVAVALYAALVTFRVMGRTYDAAIMAAGQVGFGMSSTACALAIMKSVTERHGPSPLAFVIVPMVGAFFIDITNAFIIQAFLTLPMFGF